MRRAMVVCVVAVAGAVGAVPGATAPPQEQPTVECAFFPADNVWNTDVSRLPVHEKSSTWLDHMDTDRDLHPDFGRSFGDGPYGIPITYVDAGHPRVRVRFDYDDESDHVGYPLGRDTRIEGGRRSGGDRHAIMVDRSRCRVYETFATRKRGGRWRAGSGATWSLRSHDLRPDGWTSADAAGLPILPGLLRLGEVRAGRVDHALRFTVPVTTRDHVWPARHDAGSTLDADFPPMGARFRLDPDFPTAGYGRAARVVIRAMQRYGLMLADNGSAWFFQGEQSEKWPNRLISDLKRIPASAFEAVDTSTLVVHADSGQARQ